jgi:transposase
MHVTSEASWVGIDVSKAKLDVAVHPSGARWQVDNTTAGLGALTEQLGGLGPERIVLEPTGGYEIVVAATLASDNLPVVIVNPRQVRDFARATGNWPRPTGWMPRSWRTLRRPSVPKFAPCQIPRLGR